MHQNQTKHHDRSEHSQMVYCFLFIISDIVYCDELIDHAVKMICDIKYMEI